MKFLDKIIDRFFLDPLFNEKVNGVTVSSFKSKQANLQEKIESLKSSRNDLVEMAKHITELTKDLENQSYELETNRNHMKSLVETATNFAIYRLITKIDVNTKQKETQLVFASPSLINIIGVSPENSFHEWMANMHPDDQDRVLKAHNNFSKTRQFNEIVRIFHPIKDKYIYVHFTSSGFESDDPDIDYTNGMVIDVTIEKEALIELENKERFLRESERKLAVTLDATTDGIWYLNFEKDELLFSDRYYEMLGYKPNEFEASLDNWKKLIHPDDLETALKNVEKYIESKSIIYENKFRLKTKSGDYRWISAKGKAIKQSTNGDPLYVIGNHEDITERIEAEKKIKESESRYRQLSDATFEAIFISKDGICIDLNKAAERMFRISRKDAIGKKGVDFIHPDYRDLTNRNIKSDCEILYQSVALRTNGDSFPCQIQAKVIDNIRITALYDMSEIKKTQQKLVESEEKYRLLAKNSVDVIWKTDSDLKTVYISPSIEDLSGYTPKEFLELQLDKRYDKQSVKTIRTIFNEFNKKSVTDQKKQIIRFNLNYVHKNKSKIPVRLTCTPIFEDDKFVGLQGTSTNISKEREYEKKLENQRDLLDSVLELQTDYVVRYNLDKEISYANSIYCNLFFGSTKYQGQLKPVNKIHPDDVKKHKKYYNDIQEYPYKAETEFRILTVHSKDENDYSVFHVYGVGILENDKVIEIQSVGRDVTIQSKLQKEIDHQNQLLKAIIESQTDCIARCDLDRKVLFANKSYSLVFCGTDDIYSCDDIDFIDNIYPDDIDLVKSCMEKLISEEPHNCTIEYRIVDFNGNIKFFRWQVQGILDCNGKVYEIQGIGRDLAKKY